ncbi:MAG: PAS domain S-box protein, partial [Deltaproteobacteria bacterium]|nr:PAS domain S-box protein [Deltaproteobacteria bacterium]
MADKNDNNKIPSGRFPNTVIEPFPLQDGDTVPSDILRFERLISGFSSVLIDAPAEALEDELNSWLKKFVDFFRVDRCSVVEYLDDRKTIHMLMNYIVPEVDSVPVLSDYQPPDGVIEVLEKGAIIRAEKIPDDLPQTFLGSIIEKDKTKSAIIVPFSIGNKVIGCISFSSYREEHKWPDDAVRRIKLIGEIIANAILRIRTLKALLEEMDRRKKIEERYTSIIETANVGFWIADWNQNILVVNDEYCRMSGYSREELLAKKVWDLDASGDRRKVERDLDALINNGSTHLVAIHRRKDDSLFDIEVSSKIDEKDGYICSFIRDITDLNRSRKELEERLKFEELVSEFSTTLIIPGDIQIELTNWLKRFVEFLRVDRAVVVEYLDDKKSGRVMMQYTVPDAVVPPLRDIRITPEGEIKGFQKGTIIRAEKIPDDLPESFRGGIIEKDKTKSTIIIPLS